MTAISVAQKPEQVQQRPSFFGNLSYAEIRQVMNTYMDKRTHLPILPFQEAPDANR